MPSMKYAGSYKYDVPIIQILHADTILFPFVDLDVI